MRVAGKANTIDFYESLLSYATVQGVKIPSLSEFLSLTYKESPKEAQGFDEKTDKILEAQALKSLEERRNRGK